MIVALVGNPNTGKTALFNRLTGGRRRTGNYPGVTVDEGEGRLKGYPTVRLVDLPGLYSLSAVSAEEALTRDFLLAAKPELIVNVADATNLNRNLYLTMQLMELEMPVLLAVNMMDELKKNGTRLDLNALSSALGIPVAGVSAANGEGVLELAERITKGGKPLKTLPYEGRAYRAAEAGARELLRDAHKTGYPARYAAIKLLEEEGEDLPRLKLTAEKKEKLDAVYDEAARLLDTDRQAAVADMRYAAVDRAYKKALRSPGENLAAARTARIDSVLTHKIWALPIFFCVMGLVFYLSFGLIGGFLSDKLGELFARWGALLGASLAEHGVPVWLNSLVCDGVLQGVGSVTAFLPTILTLFFFLSLIEDTGYMARVAFVTDRLMRRLGLNGRALVPILIGFGCSVPAYMATRTLTSKRDRRFTSLLIPFVPCSAKLPVYGMLTMLFFAKYRALVMLGLYLGGFAVGILYALILKWTVYRKGGEPFMMELPPYRMPAAKTTLLYLWDKGKGFVQKAFTVIFFASVAIWFFQNFGTDFKMTGNPEHSLLGVFAAKLTPLFVPLGFADWRAVTAVITGLVAKETLVSTLTVLTGGAVGGVFTVASALSFLVFVSLYMPCVAAVAALKKESGSWRFTLVAVSVQTGIAYLAAVLVNLAAQQLF